MSDDERNLKKVRYLEYCQTICILLTLLAFADIYSRIGEMKTNCWLIKDGIISRRNRRATASLHSVQTLLNTSKDEVLMHSLSKIKVSE
ncbi:unnamed protein product [Brugia timori]|uniref:Transmembrane protein n=1 Tax=Brugia timori TaxID=42155 RepID=A0A0R3QHI4_9BILA|nr:unnamed protein product [Brugia timori]